MDSKGSSGPSQQNNPNVPNKPTGPTGPNQPVGSTVPTVANGQNGTNAPTSTEPNPNETVEEYEHSYVELDGTRVTKKIIIRRIKPDIPDPAAATKHKTSSHEAVVDLSEFQRAFLDKHNEYRQLHSSPPLLLSRQLCKYAQDWADHLAHKHLHVHRPSPKKYGENIFWKMSPSFRITGDQAVNSWYEEVADYDPKWYGGDPPRDSYKVSGHFTQLVWKSSEYVGVGLAMNGNSFYVVANYHPIGNCFTRYGLNVLPPKSADSNAN